MDESETIMKSIALPRCAVIGISETWLKHSHELRYVPMGYQVVFVSWDTGSGRGVMLYMPNCLKYKPSLDLSSVFHDANTAKCVTVEISLAL